MPRPHYKKGDDTARDKLEAAFWDALAEGSYEGISVVGLCRSAGVNKNTFYYHFEDFPALVEAISREMVDRLIQDGTQIGSLEECLNVAIGFVLRYRRPPLHIYCSANRDIYERYLMKMCDYVVRRMFDTAFDMSGMSELDREVLIQGHRCLCFGLFVEWLDGGLKDDFKASMLRLCELRRGTLERIVEQAGGKYTGQIQ